TGGTHVHEFAAHVFGDDYLDKVALLSNDTLESGEIANFEELLEVVQPFEYPMNGAQRGLFITVTSALEARAFGCIIVGTNTADVIEIQREVQSEIANYLA